MECNYIIFRSQRKAMLKMKEIIKKKKEIGIKIKKYIDSNNILFDDESRYSILNSTQILDIILQKDNLCETNLFVDKNFTLGYMENILYPTLIMKHESVTIINYF